jgi:molybdenum storage protein
MVHPGGNGAGHHSAGGSDVRDRPDLSSPLMRDSLLSMSTMAGTDRPAIAMLPGIKVIKVGGRTIMDGGRARVYPLVEEIAHNLSLHKLVIGTGAGVRSRHVFSVGIDLGLPVGVLATLSAADAEQNAHMLSALLARYGVVALPAAQLIHLLPILLTLGRGAVFNGVPPYELWEHPPKLGKIPPNRTDVGVYLLAEVYGATSVVYVKDVDGVYTADPKLDPTATRIPHARVSELQQMGLETLPVDRLVLELMQLSHHCRQVQIVDGTTPGMLTRALAGEPVGTVIEADGARAAAHATRAAEDAGTSA